VTEVEVHLRVRLRVPDGVSVHEFNSLKETVVSIQQQLEDLTATVTEFNQDIAAKVAALEAATGEFTPEQQTAFDNLKAAVQAGVAAVGDADGDGNPA